MTVPASPATPELRGGSIAPKGRTDAVMVSITDDPVMTFPS
jgi:hypothetical protein